MQLVWGCVGASGSCPRGQERPHQLVPIPARLPALLPLPEGACPGCTGVSCPLHKLACSWGYRQPNGSPGTGSLMQDLPPLSLFFQE